MNYEKQYLLAEAKRFYSEYDCSPRMKDWDTDNDYPTVWYVRKAFGAWTTFLREAELPLNSPKKERIMTCEICGINITTKLANKKICNNKKCRYIRDSLYHVNFLKKKYVCSMFHFIPEDKLIEYFSCVYNVKKKNLSMIEVI